LQNVVSSVPNGEKLNYMFQKYISKSLPQKNDRFLRQVNEAFQHYSNFTKFNNLGNVENRYYEFGAGWDLTIPLTMSLLNLEVHCIDIEKLILPELICDSINKFEVNKENLPFKLKDVISCNDPDKSILGYLKDRYKLYYYAPKDARYTNFNNDYFDFISSTFTLEHISSQDILLILKECYRILKKGGVISMTIDYKDHWSYFDKNISIYNYLKYSSKEWEKYNPKLHFQNRLRHSDYIKLISKTNFNIAKVSLIHPSSNDLGILETVKLHSDFLNYDFFDLSTKGSEIVLIK